MEETSSPTVVAVPDAPEAVRRRVDLAPLVGVVIAVWFMLSPSFIRYPLGPVGENPSLRDRGVALLLLFAAVCWARARTHRRRYLLLYALFSAVLVVEAVVVNKLTGPVAGPARNELVGGVLGLVVAAAGWRSSGTDRPPPADNDEVANLRQ